MTEINLEEFCPFPEQLKEEWMLMTVGTPEKFNMLTLSWGGMGVLWHKKAVTCYVRHNRYSYPILESRNEFTLSFYDSEYKSALLYCGTHSGRDEDKVAGSKLTPVQTPEGLMTFKEASTTLVCRKMFAQDMDPENFLDETAGQHYPDKNYHKLYVAEILKSYMK